MSKRWVSIFLLVLCIAVAFFTQIPRLVDESQNKVVAKLSLARAMGEGEDYKKFLGGK